MYHATASQEWIPKCHGETKTVKNRKVRYDFFRDGQEPCGIDLCAITQNVAMCQYDALRLARTATCKEQASLKLTALVGNLEDPREKFCGAQMNPAISANALTLGIDFISSTRSMIPPSGHGNEGSYAAPARL